MRKIAVVSGKGGTGKTNITAGLFALSENSIAADCDVDAANLYLLLAPKNTKSYNFISGKDFFIQENKCTKCGICSSYCRFDAIKSDYQIDPFLCEGCATCFHNCPYDAISFKDKHAGWYYNSDTRYGKFIHAKLKAGEENSGKLVTKVKQMTFEIADRINPEFIFIDGPPGIGCPVSAALTGTDIAIIVTEPTLSAIHDLNRIIELTNHFNIQPYVIINKSTINQQNVENITDICSKINVQILGKIPHDQDVVKANINAESIVEADPQHPVSKEIKNIWKAILKIFEN